MRQSCNIFKDFIILSVFATVKQLSLQLNKNKFLSFSLVPLKHSITNLWSLGRCKIMTISILTDITYCEVDVVNHEITRFNKNLLKIM